MSKFSIIVVCLNPGDKLTFTINSILAQSYENYEVIVKDGCSKDGALEHMPEDDRIRVYIEPDKSIYDAMNQAIEKADGEYLLFLNCGDTFYDSLVLEKTALCIRQTQEQGGDVRLFYGDTYCDKTKAAVRVVSEITGFTCYRNIPCHQSCFYARELFAKRKYEAELKIRADFDHFLWCYYKEGVRPVYLNILVSSYEGNGYSEDPDNKKRDKEEHELIIRRYMKPAEIAKYKCIMALTLAPLRRYMAQSSAFSGAYHCLMDKIYGAR